MHFQYESLAGDDDSILNILNLGSSASLQNGELGIDDSSILLPPEADAGCASC